MRFLSNITCFVQRARFISHVFRIFLSLNLLTISCKRNGHKEILAFMFASSLFLEQRIYILLSSLEWDD